MAEKPRESRLSGTVLSEAFKGECEDRRHSGDALCKGVEYAGKESLVDQVLRAGRECMLTC